MLSADDAGLWWVTCFAVDPHYRRSGVGLALLDAAVEFARQHGATAAEGHPVDVAGLKAARIVKRAIRSSRGAAAGLLGRQAGS